jgi:predicted nucleic acid-binding protein
MLAPDLLIAEVGSIVWKKCRLGEVSEADGMAFLTILGNVDIALSPASELMGSALQLGLALRHSFYDCLYLALAARESVQLVTADERLHRKLTGTPYAGLTLWLGDLP